MDCAECVYRHNQNAPSTGPPLAGSGFLAGRLSTCERDQAICVAAQSSRGLSYVPKALREMGRALLLLDCFTNRRFLLDVLRYVPPNVEVSSPRTIPFFRPVSPEPPVALSTGNARTYIDSAGCALAIISPVNFGACLLPRRHLSQCSWGLSCFTVRVAGEPPDMPSIRQPPYEIACCATYQTPI